MKFTLRAILVALLTLTGGVSAFAQSVFDTAHLNRSVAKELFREASAHEDAYIAALYAMGQQGAATLSPTNPKFVTISCSGSTGTSGQVLIGGNPCTWTGSPSITNLTLTGSLSANGSIATTGSVLVGGNPAQWSSAPSLTNIQVANTLTVNTNISLIGRAFFTAPADGVLMLTNAAGTGWTRLILGTNDATTNGASLTLTSGILESKTGDATAFTGIRSNAFYTTGSGMAVANVGANSCGTTAATIAGNNTLFTFTVGATSGTQCRVTFTITAPTAWGCVANDDSTTIAVRTTAVDTTHVDFLGAFVAGDNVTAICHPR